MRISKIAWWCIVSGIVNSMIWSEGKANAWNHVAYSTAAIGIQITAPEQVLCLKATRLFPSLQVRSLLRN